MIAVDSSVLAYAINRFVPEHARAARAVESLAEGNRPWAVPVSVAHEFLALVTHPHAVARALGMDDAVGFLEQLLGSPASRLIGPTPRHLEVLRETLLLAGPLPAPVPGLETATLCREHGVRELLSCDRGMRSFPFLEVRDPCRGPEWSPEEPPRRRYRTLAGRTARDTS